MIQRFTWGNPIKTGATVVDIKPFASDKLQKFLKAEENNTKFSMELLPNDVIYGLGESLHGMNKRGFVYISDNTDDMRHDENRYSLYGSHTFILVDREDGMKLGIFVDYSAKTVWDIGFTDKDMLTIKVEEPDFDMYIISGESDLEVIEEFRTLIGDSYVAPKWAFGFIQSRWGYKCEADIEEVIKGHKDNNLPLEGVCMDIDYMDKYKVFTLDKDRFPDLPAFMAKMRKENIHLLPNVDPGVKIEAGYDIYEEGVKNNYYCKDADGKDFVTAVWPGKSVLPDFFKPEVRTWYASLYKEFLEAGIDGFWNDMNEPALFYSEKRLNELAEDMKTFYKKTDNLELYELWDFKDRVSGLANNPEDYQSFYHEIDGKKVRHDRVHNIYGSMMTAASSEAFKTYVPDKNVLLFARASYIGAHRYSGIWTGDNSSFYSHMDLIMHQLPNLNMCGFIYVGADTGGFGFNTSEPLMMRFLALSLFTPLFRDHCALGQREQELYKFKDIDAIRRILNLRYALIPYLYESAVTAATEGKLMFTPLVMAYPKDHRVRTIEDQLIVGDSIMIAPVTAPNAAGRYVYLPEDMKFIRFRAYDDYDEEMLTKGEHYIEVAIDEVPVFVLPGKTLYLAKPANNTALMKDEKFTYILG